MKNFIENFITSMMDVGGQFTLLSYIFALIFFIFCLRIFFETYKSKQKGRVLFAFFLAFFGGFWACFPEFLFNLFPGADPSWAAFLFLPLLILSTICLLLHIFLNFKKKL